MKFELLEGITIADSAFRAYGSTLPDLFKAAAHAVLSILLQNPESIQKKVRREIHLQEENLELLLFSFLNEFIYYKDTGILLLVPHTIEIIEGKEWILHCTAEGDSIDTGIHQFHIDIKAITLHHLAIVKDHDGWNATVVVDV